MNLQEQGQILLILADPLKAQDCDTKHRKPREDYYAFGKFRQIGFEPIF